MGKNKQWINNKINKKKPKQTNKKKTNKLRRYHLYIEITSNTDAGQWDDHLIGIKNAIIEITLRSDNKENEQKIETKINSYSGVSN